MPRLHHTCDSARVAWAKYDEESRELYLCFRPKLDVYRYKDVPGHVFTNLLTAKSRETPIAKENPRSEGSFLIHHVIGSPKSRPFEYERLSPEEAERLSKEGALK